MDNSEDSLVNYGATSAGETEKVNNAEDLPSPSLPFSPIKFTMNSCSPKTTMTSVKREIIDEEISLIKRPAENPDEQNEQLCNTPKRDRKEGQPDYRSRNTNEEVEKEEEESSILKTPQKTNINTMVKSLSIEFEQRLASIHVSPKPKSSTLNNHHHSSSPTMGRAMSPIRCVAEASSTVSPGVVSKLNLNDDNDEEVEETTIETPRLISPSKLASVKVQAKPENVVNEDPVLDVVVDVANVQVTPSTIEPSNPSLDINRTKEIEFLQYEIGVLQEKYEGSLNSNAEMRAMLSEYEKTLAQFIDARRMRPDQHSSLDQLLADKKKLELELQTIQISYQNLHQRYEDAKGLQEQARINDATLRQSIQVLQQELATTVRTLDNVRRAYEEKLEKVTVDAKNNKETLELELSSSKAKLLKSELKISSLESAIESKSRENSELMTICDELIHKMDKRCT